MDAVLKPDTQRTQSENDDVLIRPENYHQITHPEHRLFISAEYVPLFVEGGWKRQPA